MLQHGLPAAIVVPLASTYLVASPLAFWQSPVHPCHSEARPPSVFCAQVMAWSATEERWRTRPTRRLWLAVSPLPSSASRNRPANRRLAAGGRDFRDRGARRILRQHRSTSLSPRDTQPQRSGRRLQRATYSSSRSSHRRYSGRAPRYTNERMDPSVALTLAYLWINDDEPVAGKLQISAVRKARRFVVSWTEFSSDFLAPSAPRSTQKGERAVRPRRPPLHAASETGSLRISAGRERRGASARPRRRDEFPARRRLRVAHPTPTGRTVRGPTGLRA